MEFVKDGERFGVEIFKDPITDDGTKKSAMGLTIVLKDENNEYLLKDRCTWDEVFSEANQLKTVFLNSELVNPTTLTKIKETLAQYN